MNLSNDKQKQFETKQMMNFNELLFDTFLKWSFHVGEHHVNDNFRDVYETYQLDTRDLDRNLKNVIVGKLEPCLRGMNEEDIEELRELIHRIEYWNDLFQSVETKNTEKEISSNLPECFEEIKWE